MRRSFFLALVPSVALSAAAFAGVGNRSFSAFEPGRAACAALLLGPVRQRVRLRLGGLPPGVPIGRWDYLLTPYGPGPKPPPLPPSCDSEEDAAAQAVDRPAIPPYIGRISAAYLPSFPRTVRPAA